MVAKGDKVRLILDVPVREVFSDGLQIGTAYNSAVILTEWIKHVEVIPDRWLESDNIVRGYN